MSGLGRGALKKGEGFARAQMRRGDGKRVPTPLSHRWRTPPPQASPSFADRLRRDRIEIVPWLNGILSLDGARILEIGCGNGTSCLALAEQGAVVTGIDVDAEATAHADQLLRAVGLEGTFECRNADQLSTLGSETFDLVIFWASLEHMTGAERAGALEGAWKLVEHRRYLALVETPNRLWPYDSHTSQLPFFSWLPDDLAFHYSRLSTRKSLQNTYHDPDQEMLSFLRRGRGVSFHEFDLAIEEAVTVGSCLQLERRRENRLRGIAWALSSAGRTERVLRSFAPERDRAWFQPFLYLALQKGVSAAG